MISRLKNPVRLIVCSKCVYSSDTILGNLLLTDKLCDRCKDSISNGAIIQLPMKLQKDL